MEDRKKVEMIKNKYPVGTRIRLNYTDDCYSLASGCCGTVKYVDDEGQIGMQWDNGRTLSLIYGVDSFDIINSDELAYEKPKKANERQL